jgi:hypothetical protein
MLPLTIIILVFATPTLIIKTTTIVMATKDFHKSVEPKTVFKQHKGDWCIDNDLAPGILEGYHDGQRHRLSGNSYHDATPYGDLQFKHNYVIGYRMGWTDAANGIEQQQC